MSTAVLLGYDGPLTFTNQLYAWLAINLAMLPLAVYFAPGPREDFPIFELLMTYYAVSFGWTAFAPALDWRGLSEPAISDAYVVALLGIMALLAGYYLVRSRLRIPYYGIAFRGRLPRTFTYVAGVILLAANIGSFLLPASMRGGAVEQFRSAAGGCGLAMLWLHYYKPDTTSSERAMTIALTLGLLLIQATIASVKPLVVPMVIIGVSYWRVRRRVPVRMIVLAVMAFAILNPVKIYWRERVWHSSHEIGLVENIGFLADAFDDYYFGANTGAIEGASRAINRLSDIAILGRARSYTPGTIPFWHGQSLQVLLYSFVPRFIWPGKPAAQFSNQFGRMYEIIAWTNRMTLISINWITELYVNYGHSGVLLGMLLIGWLTRCVQQSIGAPGVGDLQFAVGVGAAGPLFNGGENLAMVWGGLPLKLIVLMVFTNVLYQAMYLTSSGGWGVQAGVPDNAG